MNKHRHCIQPNNRTTTPALAAAYDSSHQQHSPAASTRSIAIALSICVIALCAAGTASANEKKHWYFGGSIGSANNTLSGENSPKGSTEKIAATGFKLYGGYQFNKNFAAELAYINFGKYSSVSPDWRITAKTTALGMSAVGTLPLSTNFSVLGRAGVLAKMVNADGRHVTDRQIYTMKSTKVAPLFGVGAEYRFTPAISLRAEYEYVGKTGFGDEKLKLANDLLSIGLRVRF
ncbi:outer membrane beta-barrel protein [Herbaspirillum sp. alder98]|uniref:outer membrane beta-barrel protein n=1 Tax=Herbaspirillum sp. alder98 TaxID=2913096 RepID=UPI001CD8B160|nr:outer membrane beta-barrel protein [Herbaspirillum sp. alder98]MCA1326019.1 outer membrane beta-barrel protein [Herbaspirillum sp. alder98]